VAGGTGAREPLGTHPRRLTIHPISQPE